MTRHRRHFLVGALTAASVLLISGCASANNTPAGGTAALGSVWPAPPAGDVIAQGTVMDVDGAVELCLGAIMESYPPQCSGVPITNWTWDDIDGSENSGEVTWGAYAVQGTYDGESFTVTEEPIMLALYDPMMAEDPTGGEPGEGEEAELLSIQEELPDRLGEGLLGSGPQDGWLWVDVVWDDGTWQDAADAEFGPQKVLIRSAMREVSG
ncbi:hypothetical protein LG299_02005 [Microbacterium lacus]|uniref:hypothetical protein n=1 Tax=Microbacterium lacus TaxID=415217 RepID=UPI00384B8D43